MPHRAHSIDVFDKVGSAAAGTEEHQPKVQHSVSLLENVEVVPCMPQAVELMLVIGPARDVHLYAFVKSYKHGRGWCTMSMVAQELHDLNKLHVEEHNWLS